MDFGTLENIFFIEIVTNVKIRTARIKAGVVVGWNAQRQVAVLRLPVILAPRNTSTRDSSP